MAFVETELHKIHLRLEALEAKAALEDHLVPDSKVIGHSDVKLPEVEAEVVPEKKKGKKDNGA